MSPGQRIQLYLDDSRIGSGYRRFLVLEVGRKWATLFYAPTLAKLRLPIEAVERNPSYEEVETNRRLLRRLIKDAVKTRKRLGLGYSEDAVKTALDMLG
jgi:hypothetical protein